MAMSSQKTGEAFPKGGYGIHLQEDSNSYILFADCDGDGKYDETGNVFITCAEATPDNPFPEAIKEIFLEEGIEVSALEPYALDPYSGDKTLEITYFPPDPIVTITPAASSASIALSFDGSTKTIYLNSGGLIDIDQKYGEKQLHDFRSNVGDSYFNHGRRGQFCFGSTKPDCHLFKSNEIDCFLFSPGRN